MAVLIDTAATYSQAITAPLNANLVDNITEGAVKTICCIEDGDCNLLATGEVVGH